MYIYIHTYLFTYIYYVSHLCTPIMLRYTVAAKKNKTYRNIITVTLLSFLHSKYSDGLHYSIYHSMCRNLHGYLGCEVVLLPRWTGWSSQAIVVAIVSATTLYILSEIAVAISM